MGNHSWPSGTIVWADFQTAGRGRMGRSWQAPSAEALLFSVLLDLQSATLPPTAYTFLAALAVYYGIGRLNVPLSPAIKWPNDILIDNRKVCGILAQTRLNADPPAVIIGIGVNVNQSPSFFRDDRAAGISLAMAAGQTLDRQTVLVAILLALDEMLGRYCSAGLPEILQEWKRYCVGLGKPVEVTDGRHRYSGIFTDVGPRGEMCLRDQRGRIRSFFAADVTIVKGEKDDTGD